MVSVPKRDKAHARRGGGQDPAARVGPAAVDLPVVLGSTSGRCDGCPLDCLRVVGSAGIARLIVLLLALAAVSNGWAANQLQLDVERLSHPQFDAEQLQIQAVPATAQSAPMLRLSAARLRVSSLDQNLRDVRFECLPEPVLTPDEVADDADGSGDRARHDGPWRCEGPLQWRGGQGWQLAWQADAALTSAQITLRHGNGRVRMNLPLAGSPLRLSAQRAPATWLSTLLPQLAWQGGRIDADIELQTPTASGSEWHGRVQGTGLAAETPDGVLAFAGVSLAGPLRLRMENNGSLHLRSTPVLSAGELLVAAVYMEWPADSEVGVTIDATGRAGIWRIDRFDVRDAGFELDATAELAAGEEPWLRRLAARVDMDLARHYQRYVEGAMAGFGHGGLAAQGRVEAQIQLSEDIRIERFDARLDEVGLGYPDGRLVIGGLTGDLAFRRDREDTAPIALSWSKLKVHALEFEPGQLQAVTEFGEFRSSQDLRLGLFGGEIVASDLVLRPLAERRDRIEASVALREIDIARLSRAFGWPEFSGQLDGALPDLRYVDDVLTAGGEIDIRVFDGTVRVLGLGIERPFGVAPALAADMRWEGLDLDPMTEVFGFGRIEGRLEGHLIGLRLVDWRPVAFDARLRTAQSGRRRISQLAVNQLTELGGGGGIGGVQGRLMGVFESFGYRAIGLSCRLHNEVCQMSGLDEVAGGYTILQGSGLPSITVRGFQSRVDWPVLVERLQAIAGGQGPVVQ